MTQLRLIGGPLDGRLVSVAAPLPRFLTVTRPGARVALRYALVGDGTARFVALVADLWTPGPLGLAPLI